MRSPASLKPGLYIGLAILWALGLLANICCAEESSKNRPVIILGYGESSSSYQGRWLQLVYQDAFQRLGYQLEYRHLPYNRLSLMADSGAVDGELSRPYDYGFFHPNLIRVETAHHADALCVITADKGLVLQGWESLNGSDYLIDYLSGDEKTHTRLLPIVDASRLTEISEVGSAMHRLVKGRSQLFIVSEQVVSQYLDQQMFQGEPIFNAGSMEQIDSHAYLHKRHLTLIPELDKALKKIHSEGLFEYYRRVAMGQLERYANTAVKRH
ncbi:MAG: hypothetical protein OQK12_06635 [Motiliproteus sp.]|nr:hypothetical protein [Motiliproteus sp.]MCW9052078.1 hypothetical protein [Motiliproteus sp.]